MARLVHEFLEESSRRLPEKVCLVHRGRRYSYAAIEEGANRLARELVRIGVGRGDRVAVQLNNSVEAVISIFGALKAGAAFVPVNPTVKEHKLRYLVGNCRPAVLITHGSKLPLAQGCTGDLVGRIIAVEAPAGEGALSFEDIVASGPATPPRPDIIDLDLAAVIYTSSSTGPAKGVMLSHLNMVSAATSINAYLENTERDVILDMLPISFDYGLYQIFLAFQAGATVVLEKPFTYMNDALDLIEAERVTGFPGVPTVFAMLLAMKDLGRRDFSSLRYVTNTAAALPVVHIRRLRELLPRAAIFSMYGLTECKRVSFLPPGQIDARPGSVGKAMPNVEVAILGEAGEPLGPGQVGELVVRGANVMLGYWGMPEATAACLRPGRDPGERTLHTGDLFRADEEGYLYFVGRRDDIIKSRGEKVSPREIETVVHGFPGVAEVAVVGVPDPILGEAVKLFVTIDAGSKQTAEDIQRLCAASLESVQVPKSVSVVAALPRTQSGKVDTKALREETVPGCMGTSTGGTTP